MKTSLKKCKSFSHKAGVRNFEKRCKAEHAVIYYQIQITTEVLIWKAIEYLK